MWRRRPGRARKPIADVGEFHAFERFGEHGGVRCAARQCAEEIADGVDVLQYVNRTLRGLRERGRIDFDRRVMRLLDRPGPETVADEE